MVQRATYPVSVQVQRQTVRYSDGGGGVADSPGLVVVHTYIGQRIIPKGSSFKREESEGGVTTYTIRWFSFSTDDNPTAPAGFDLKINDILTPADDGLSYEVQDVMLFPLGVTQVVTFSTQ